MGSNTWRRCSRLAFLPVSTKCSMDAPCRCAWLGLKLPCCLVVVKPVLQVNERHQNNQVGQCVQQRRQQEAVAAAAGGSCGGRCDDYINRVHDTVNVSSQRAAPRLPVALARFWPGFVAPFS